MDDYESHHEGCQLFWGNIRRSLTLAPVGSTVSEPISMRLTAVLLMLLIVTTAFAEDRAIEETARCLNVSVDYVCQYCEYGCSSGTLIDD